MALRVPLVWSDRHRLHEPGGEVWVGRPIDGNETPERAEAIRAALEEAGAQVHEAEPHDGEAMLAVHAPDLIAFLERAWREWEADGFPADAGQEHVVPYLFPLPGLTGGLPVPEAKALSARTGRYAYDTMTPIGRGTWEAVRAGVDTTLTAADLVLAGAPAAYACTRPPGHHATRTSYGGSCYVNNAAIAAQYLRDHGLGRVAIVDVDAHHGNGAQDIFWERGDVFTGSVHVDPGAGWFPHYLGFAGERGVGEGEGANLNRPLAPGSGDEAWLEAVGELTAAVEADALVVALGVDAAEGDELSPLEVTPAGFREAGRLLGRLGLPTVVVQEGGYDVATIGGLVRETLAGLEAGLSATLAGQ